VRTIAFLLLAAGAAQAQSGAVRQAARELARFLESRFAREVAEEGVERLEPRLARMIAERGDEAVLAVRRVGPGIGLRAIETHGATAARFLARWGDDGARALAAEGDDVLRLWARHGDDAMAAILRHPGSGARIVETLGPAGARASQALSERGAVQLAGVADGVRRSGRAADVLRVVERFGDRACDFLWRNKGAVFGAALLAAFLADPEPYLDGLKQLVVEPAKELGLEAARRADWTTIIVASLVLLAMWAGLKTALRRRATAPSARAA
jgi:hypothetical protein